MKILGPHSRPTKSYWEQGPATCLPGSKLSNDVPLLWGQGEHLSLACKGVHVLASTYVPGRLAPHLLAHLALAAGAFN